MGFEVVGLVVELVGLAAHVMQDQGLQVAVVPQWPNELDIREPGNREEAVQAVYSH